jgi:hypothetical protein
LKVKISEARLSVWQDGFVRVSVPPLEIRFLNRICGYPPAREGRQEYDTRQF